MSTLLQFLKEVPLWFLWGGLFLPVTLLILLVRAHLVLKLLEVEAELSAAPDPRETAQHLLYGPRVTHRRRAGERMHT